MILRYGSDMCHWLSSRLVGGCAFQLIASYMWLLLGTSREILVKKGLSSIKKGKQLLAPSHPKYSLAHVPLNVFLSQSSRFD